MSVCIHNGLLIAVILLVLSIVEAVMWFLTIRNSLLSIYTQYTVDILTYIICVFLALVIFAGLVQMLVRLFRASRSRKCIYILTIFLLILALLAVVCVTVAVAIMYFQVRKINCPTSGAPPARLAISKAEHLKSSGQNRSQIMNHDANDINGSGMANDWFDSNNETIEESTVVLVEVSRLNNRELAVTLKFKTAGEERAVTKEPVLTVNSDISETKYVERPIKAAPMDNKHPIKKIASRRDIQALFRKNKFVKDKNVGYGYHKQMRDEPPETSSTCTNIFWAFLIAELCNFLMLICLIVALVHINNRYMKPCYRVGVCPYPEVCTPCSHGGKSRSVSSCMPMKHKCIPDRPCIPKCLPDYQCTERQRLQTKCGPPDVCEYYDTKDCGYSYGCKPEVKCEPKLKCSYEDTPYCTDSAEMSNDGRIQYEDIPNKMWDKDGIVYYVRSSIPDEMWDREGKQYKVRNTIPDAMWDKAGNKYDVRSNIIKTRGNPNCGEEPPSVSETCGGVQCRPDRACSDSRETGRPGTQFTISYRSGGEKQNEKLEQNSFSKDRNDLFLDQYASHNTRSMSGGEERREKIFSSQHKWTQPVTMRSQMKSNHLFEERYPSTVEQVRPVIQFVRRHKRSLSGREKNNKSFVRNYPSQNEWKQPQSKIVHRDKSYKKGFDTVKWNESLEGNSSIQNEWERPAYRIVHSHMTQDRSEHDRDKNYELHAERWPSQNELEQPETVHSHKLRKRSDSRLENNNESFEDYSPRQIGWERPEFTSVQIHKRSVSGHEKKNEFRENSPCHNECTWQESHLGGCHKRTITHGSHRDRSPCRDECVHDERQIARTCTRSVPVHFKKNESYQDNSPCNNECVRPETRIARSCKRSAPVNYINNESYSDNCLCHIECVSPEGRHVCTNEFCDRGRTETLNAPTPCSGRRKNGPYEETCHYEKVYGQPVCQTADSYGRAVHGRKINKSRSDTHIPSSGILVMREERGRAVSQISRSSMTSTTPIEEGNQSEVEIRPSERNSQRAGYRITRSSDSGESKSCKSRQPGYYIVPTGSTDSCISNCSCTGESSVNTGEESLIEIGKESLLDIEKQSLLIVKESLVDTGKETFLVTEKELLVDIGEEPSLKIQEESLREIAKKVLLESEPRQIERCKEIIDSHITSQNKDINFCYHCGQNLHAANEREQPSDLIVEEVKPNINECTQTNSTYQYIKSCECPKQNPCLKTLENLKHAEVPVDSVRSPIANSLICSSHAPSCNCCQCRPYEQIKRNTDANTMDAYSRTAHFAGPSNEVTKYSPITFKDTSTHRFSVQYPVPITEDTKYPALVPSIPNKEVIAYPPVVSQIPIIEVTTYSPVVRSPITIKDMSTLRPSAQYSVPITEGTKYTTPVPSPIPIKQMKYSPVVRSPIQEVSNCSPVVNYPVPKEGTKYPPVLNSPVPSSTAFPCNCCNCNPCIYVGRSKPLPTAVYSPAPCSSTLPREYSTASPCVQAKQMTETQERSRYHQPPCSPFQHIEKFTEVTTCPGCDNEECPSILKSSTIGEVVIRVMIPDARCEGECSQSSTNPYLIPYNIRNTRPNHFRSCWSEGSTCSAKPCRKRPYSSDQEAVRIVRS